MGELNMVKRVNKLPKNPRKGELYAVSNKQGRLITFKATGKRGFGRWEIQSNEPL